jgi:hypothetical protein
MVGIDLTAIADPSRHCVLGFQVGGGGLGHDRRRREKPRVSAFPSADVPKILDLKPDLVLTFSDLQADIAATLIRHGIEVHGFISEPFRKSSTWS